MEGRFARELSADSSGEGAEGMGTRDRSPTPSHDEEHEVDSFGQDGSEELIAGTKLTEMTPTIVRGNNPPTGRRKAALEMCQETSRGFSSSVVFFWV